MSQTFTSYMCKSKTMIVMGNHCRLLLVSALSAAAMLLTIHVTNLGPQNRLQKFPINQTQNVIPEKFNSFKKTSDLTEAPAPRVTNTAKPKNLARIFCLVLTSPGQHATKAKAVKETWGKRCDTLVFFSSVVDKELDSIAIDNVKEERLWIWAKAKGAFQYTWDHHRDDADWFLKADDDTFVIIENLREYLSQNFKPSDPVYIGTNAEPEPFNKNGYMYGGTGYILSHRTLERFIKEAVPNETICEPATPNPRPHYRGDEDVELGRCLNNIGGIRMVVPRDSKGRWRMMPEPPEDYAEKNELPQTKEDSKKCCEDTAISFHHLQPSHM